MDSKPGTVTEPAGANRPAKRTKIALACEECRSKKIRCDGQRPNCRSCVKKNIECIYALDKSKEDSNLTRKYIEHLERRLLAVEKGHRSTGDGSHESPFTLKSPNLNPTPARVLERNDVGLNFQTSSPTSEPVDGAQIPLPASTLSSYTTAEPVQNHLDKSHVSFAATSGISQSRNDAERDYGLHMSPLGTSGFPVGVDGMGAMEGESQHSSQGYFGQSSAAIFMHQIKDIIENRTGSGSGPQNSSARSLSLHSPSAIEQIPAEDYSLPPRIVADRLLRTYWVKYDNLWSGNGPRSTAIFHCTLNMALATACQLDESISPESRDASSLIYFNRGKHLLRFDILEAGSLELVQALLIMGQYLQSTDSPSRCWLVIGLAIRIAQGLGLGHPEATSMLHTQLEKEMARRIWHGCVLMDRILALTFGRPIMISERYASSIPLPAAIDDEYLSTSSKLDGTQNNQYPSRMEFFNATLKLYEIMSDILRRFYNSGEERLWPIPQKASVGNLNCQNYSAVVDFDQRLTNFWESLPPILKLSEEKDGINTESIFLRQSNVLRSRYLHIKTILFRPMLAQLTLNQNPIHQFRSNNESQLQHSLVLQSSILCVSAARELISLNFKSVPKDKSGGHIAAWWYIVFYAYTAALTLLAARICPPISAEISSKELNVSWQQCIQLLQRYQSHSTSARRCIAALEVLNAKARSQHPTRHASPAVSESENGFGMSTEGIGDIDWSGSFNGLEDMDLAWLNSVPFDLDFKI